MSDNDEGERMAEIVDTALAHPLAERPPAVEGALSGELTTPPGREVSGGSGAVDSADPIRIAKRDNTQALER